MQPSIFVVYGKGKVERIYFLFSLSWINCICFCFYTNYDTSWKAMQLHFKRAPDAKTHYLGPLLGTWSPQWLKCSKMCWGIGCSPPATFFLVLSTVAFKYSYIVSKGALDIVTGGKWEKLGIKLGVFTKSKGKDKRKKWFTIGGFPVWWSG